MRARMERIAFLLVCLRALSYIVWMLLAAKGPNESAAGETNEEQYCCVNSSAILQHGDARASICTYE